MIENSTNFCQSEHYIDKVINIDDYDIIFTNGNGFYSIESYEEVICFFDWDLTGLEYFFRLKTINPNCEFYVSEQYMRIAKECFRNKGIDYVTIKNSFCYNRPTNLYTDNVRKVIEFLTNINGIVEQEAFLAYDNEMQLIPSSNQRIVASLKGESHSAINEHIQISYMIDGVLNERFIRKIELGHFLDELVKKHGLPYFFNRKSDIVTKSKSIKLKGKFAIHVSTKTSGNIITNFDYFDYQYLITCIKFNKKLKRSYFNMYRAFESGLNREQENTLKSLLPTIKNPEIKAIVISILAVNKHQKEEEGEIMKDKILESVSDLEPSKKTVKVCDSKLRYITDLLVESDLVVRVADEKFYHLPLNFYREIYKAVRTMPEFKKLVQDDLNNRIKECVISWKAKKRIKYDTILKQSEISKTNFVLSRMKGTTAEKSIMVDGKRKKHIMVDGRLVKHLMNEFKHDEDFKKRFL